MIHCLIVNCQTSDFFGSHLQLTISISMKARDWTSQHNIITLSISNKCMISGRIQAQALKGTLSCFAVVFLFLVKVEMIDDDFLFIPFNFVVIRSDPRAEVGSRVRNLKTILEIQNFCFLFITEFIKFNFLRCLISI